MLFSTVWIWKVGCTAVFTVIKQDYLITSDQVPRAWCTTVHGAHWRSIQRVRRTKCPCYSQSQLRNRIPCLDESGDPDSPAEWSKPLDDPFFFNRKVLKLVGSWLKDWHDRWGPDLINKVGRPRSSKPLVTSPRWVGPMHATISLSCYLSKDSSRLLVLAKRNLSPPKQPQNHGTVPIEVCTITFPTNIIQSHSWHRRHRRATVGKSDSPIKRQV